jgi:hypothetical protein
MDLLASTWMSRSLGEAVASVALDDDHSVLVGGWNGALKRWDEKGELLWSTQLNDRINDLAVNNECVIATAGLHLVCIEKNTGDVRWTHALEGSADATVIHNEVVHAVSSVYDIEHNDFIESAVWAYDLKGDEQWVTRMDERPWTMLAHDTSLWIGLGRPKCGFATVGKDGSLTHIEGPVDSPITCGSAGKTSLFFGHADGTVSDHMSNIVLTRSSGIESLASFEDGIVVADEGGDACAFDAKGVQRWCLKGVPIVSHCGGFESNGAKTHWIARWSGSEGSLEAVNAESGEVLAISSQMHVRFMHSNEQRLIVGCENGDVHVWERSVFDRRLSTNSEEDEGPKDARKSALQDKLRKLRER